MLKNFYAKFKSSAAYQNRSESFVSVSRSQNPLRIPLHDSVRRTAIAVSFAAMLSLTPFARVNSAAAQAQSPGKDLQKLLNESADAYQKVFEPNITVEQKEKIALQSLEIWYKGYPLALERGEKKFAALFAFRIGYVEHDRKNYDTALKWERLALKHYTEVQDMLGQAKTTLNLHSLLTDMGRYHEANEAGLQCVRLFESLPEFAEKTQWLGKVYNNQGIGLMNIEQYDAARASLNKARLIFQQLKMPEAESYALASIGAICEYEGNLPDAIDLMRQALKFSDARPAMLSNLGKMLYLQANQAGESQNPSRFNEAKTVLEQAMTQGDERVQMRCKRFLAEIAKSLKQWDECKRLLQEVLDYCHSKNLTQEAENVEIQLGSLLLEQGKIDEAKAAFLRLLPQIIERKSVSDEAALQYNLAGIYAKQEDWQGAEKALRRVLILAEPLIQNSDSLSTLVSSQSGDHRRYLRPSCPRFCSIKTESRRL